MLYFKNNDLAETYHVSLRTVLNWIEASRKGKLGLTLHETANKAYVSNTARNIAIIESIVEERRKYRNGRGQKTITPKKAFYQLYNQQQILDIVSNLDIRREIPLQYTYFDKGATYWDGYVKRLAAETTPNSLNYTHHLIASNQSYIDNLLREYARINVIDIGVGNALPAKPLIEHLLHRGVMGRYMAIDISKQMLQVAQNNVTEWFGSQVLFEGYQYDVTYEKFPNLLASEYIKRQPEKTINLILLLGGTLSNLRSPDTALRVLHDSMGRRDLLIYSRKLDTNTNRRYFDFRLGQEDRAQAIPEQAEYIVDLLNIDRSYYSVETGYDNNAKCRFLSLRLKLSLSIKFVFEEGEQIVHLYKDDTVLIWRSWHQSGLDIMQQLDRCELYPLLMSQSADKEYVLTLSQVKQN